MILKRLYEFGTEQMDSVPVGYLSAFVTKRIRLDGTGKFLGVSALSGDTKGQREGMLRSVPREQPQRTVGTSPRLLADNANYVLGKEREKDGEGKSEKRHKAFVEMISNCVTETGESAVKAVLNWLNSGGPATLAKSEATEEDDEFVFEVDGIDPTTLKSVEKYWANSLVSDFVGRCMVTGDFGPIVDRMPIPIKGVPDGQMSGTALVTVNNSPGESYGLKASLNSPIGAIASEQICNALNHLLSDKKHHYRVGKVVYTYWTTSPETFDIFTALTTPESEEVKQLLSSPFLGRQVKYVNQKDFFVLVLSANASRIVVREFIETSVDEVKINLTNWFDRIGIVGANGEAPKPPKLLSLAGSLFRELKDMPAHVPTSLIESALKGKPLPVSLLGLAVKRNIAMQGPYYESNKKRYLSTERVAIIKAVLDQKGGSDLSALNKTHPDAAYHCGRLLAILENIQKAALGNINATIVDRYYGAACTSPGSILGNLVNDSRTHLSKLRKGKSDGWAQRELQEVLSAIGDAFPKTLNLQRQGLFALGFYHQKADNAAAAIAGRAEKENKENESE